MLIRQHGVQGTSVAQLVAASGTSAGAIYHHFSGKNAVVVEVARSAISIPLAALKEYLDRPASPAQLATMREVEATAKVTPTHVLVGVTDTTCSGVPGSGLTSPEAPTTSTAHEEPEA